MSRTNVSRCTIPAKNRKNLFIKVKNMNEKLSRHFNLDVYEKDAPTKTSLPVFLNDQLINEDTLKPGSEKVYRVDVSTLETKVIFEIMQKKGGSGIKVARNSKNPSSVELQIK